MKKEKNNFKKPNVIIYSIFYIISKLVSKLMFRLKIEKNEIKKIKGPYVVIANHQSFIDFINLACCTRKRISFVVSNSMYQSMKINPLMKLCGVIPKQQFQTNVSDMKKMRSAIQAGRPLAIYPAGLMTENGLSTPIPEATGKFLQWLGVDVYLAYTKGSYFTNPKWGKGFRKGKITLNVTKLIAKEELKNYTSDELQLIVHQSLDYNAYQQQENDMIPYKKGNSIKGLENVLYWCPKCNKEFTNKNISYDTMKCSYCGNEVYLDKFGFINPKTENDIYYKHVSDWYNKIYNNLYEEVKENNEYYLQSNMTLKMLDYKKHQFYEVGTGNVILNKEKFIINVPINNEYRVIEVPIKTIPILPFKPGVHFEIQDGNVIYRCCLDNPQEVTKWIVLLKIFYELNNK